MADDFDRLLAEALSPPERDADRVFVSQVQTQIAIEERFAMQRRSLCSGLAQQLAALLAIGAGAWWLGTSAPIAAWASESPATALAIMLALFMFVAALFTLRTGAGEQTAMTL